LTIGNKLEQSQQLTKGLKLCANKIQYRIERFTIQILLQSKVKASWTICKTRQFQNETYMKK